MSTRRLSQQTIKEKANLLLDFIYSNYIGKDHYLRKDFTSKCNDIIGNTNIGPVVVQKMLEKGLMELRNSQFIKGQKVIVWISPVKPNLQALTIILNDSYDKVRMSKSKSHQKAKETKQPEVALDSVEWIETKQDPFDQLNSELLLIKNKYQSIMEANIVIEVKVVKTKELTV